MRKLIAICVLIMVAVSSMADVQAVLTKIKGKVEIKPEKGNWTAAREGMKINILSTISTGFDASVVLVMDKNEIQVNPLTRMTLDKLLESQGTVSTSLYLRVGSVKASVKSAESVKQDFKVQSPYSTASVRGTLFETDGISLTTLEGAVAFVPGRPVRDIVLPPAAQPAAGGEGGTTGGEGTTGGTTGGEGGGTMTDAELQSYVEMDFTGAPEASETPQAAVTVGANQAATVTLVFVPGGTTSQTMQSGQSQLQQGSTGSQGGSTGSTSNAPVVKTGGVVVKWKDGEAK
jgi:hypothetical protein